MKRILTILIALILSQMACLETTEPFVTYPANGTTAPPAAITPQLTTGDTPEAPEENPAGAVFIIPTMDPPALCAAVTASKALHLRAEPGEKSDVLDYLANGQQLKLIGKVGTWWKVRILAGEHQGLTGYANSRWLEEEQCR